MKNLFQQYGWLKKISIGIIVFVFPFGAFAAGPPKPSELSNPLAIVMLIMIVGLLLAIALLANVVMGAADMYLQRFKEEKKRSDNTAGKIVSVIIFCLISTSLFSQTPSSTEATSDSSVAGLSAVSFYSLLSVLLLELIIILALLYNLKSLLRKEALAIKAADEEYVVPTENSFIKWWDKFNSFKPIQEEASIDLGHNYDGIRELDNRLPPWWLYGFYICILFAGIYLYRYHVAHSAPLSAEELRIDLAKAEVDKQDYLKRSANNIDENNVKLLTDPNDLAEAKKIFTTICAACHKPDGGGLVGPNLTDDYWLHGGSIKDIFKTIKYGWPEKGMKSWKDDYSPLQIEQLASYVKSLHGTKPLVAKEPQGSLYIETTTTDSTKNKTDTLKAGSGKKK